MLVFGLFLDGASWDPHHECLNDSRPGDRFSKLPEIHFEPVQVNLPTLSSEISKYTYVPVYLSVLFIKFKKTDTKND